MHIREMLADAERTKAPSFSFEYFPPKTAQGVQNLYDRMDRMYNFGPKFIDITWGAGGRIAELTCEMVAQAQAYLGLETCMHLTCTDMGEEKVNNALQRAYKAGCTNILALRGDPPREKERWEAAEGGFQYARDLVAHIRKLYGDHFDIGVAGYPEGCDDNKDEESLLDHLKEKVDMGASFIVTQMFYDVDNFLRWVKRVRERGITIPIIPGIMPIATYASFIRRANHMNCKIPEEWMAKLEPVKNDDVAVREIGKTLVAEMCRKIVDAGIRHLHFYTMNLAQATRMVLEELDWLPSPNRPLKRALPWKQSLGSGRRDEDVRPIFWRNRNKSYITRTQDWDEFPNGRWGDSRSPAFGELDAYGIGLTGSNELNRKKWGEPQTVKDIANLFVRYLNQELEYLPWSEAPISSEAELIKDDLIALNNRGLITINSQPAVNGVKSTHPVHGWGPANGYVYQKAYLELLVSPELFPEIKRRIEDHPDITYYAVTKSGNLHTNAPSEGPNAVTWGVFPGKEIVQPTIVESISFLAWKDEAFQLGLEWARCYDADTPSRLLIEDIMNKWYLINIVNNDFHQPRTIFEILNDLSLPDLEKVYTPAHTNGATNGVSEASTVPQ
ncbi:methylenetetrahydrofolate reductase 1 [Neurospora tetrasperma FGSC 2508]|uniref:Methylenetetrahydrofolate reductase 1 n=2 Tax=Neurospora TaxID=5140 RepID=A0AAJ0MND1_9PEZI|nr:methylenetetrahydrofolate reductase 1 [Neurospora tetrasperma FGSC 2508]EGO59058.1 methylenetetrahydrofolate reductase 1 [Neurospora tetrasperma FGSC 2508]EGZ73162.1 methylenetetrahydrofolate reductase 1 [Neurospora tetrasperma FGSC 2509]KAK3487710.1 methylenetetrahydrofolate reductase 1 [Neurospora hispaniola]